MIGWFISRIHGISVSDDAAYFHGHVDEVLKAVGLENVKSRDILDIIDGHKGKGYGISTKEELGIKGIKRTVLTFNK